MPEGAALPVVGSQPQWWGRLFWEELNVMFEEPGVNAVEMNFHNTGAWVGPDGMSRVD